jgi:TPR repeat protein
LLNIGVGVAQDSVAAATWFAKAAAQGHAGAQHNLGVAYFKGAGVALDFELADRWFRKAAAQGQRDAINALAKIQRARADAAAARPRG